LPVFDLDAQKEFPDESNGAGFGIAATKSLGK
jgi:hypothetical protein